MLDAAGTIFDYLCPHHYEIANLVGEERNFKGLRDWIAANGGGKDIRVGVTEWNTTAGDFGLTRGMLQTLGNALSISRYLNLMQRYADLVEIANRSNFADSFGSGFVQTGPGWIYEAPAYYAQEMYGRAAGAYPLRLERSSKLRLAPAGTGPEREHQRGRKEAADLCRQLDARSTPAELSNWMGSRRE